MRPTMTEVMMLMRMTVLDDTNSVMSGRAMSMPPMPVSPLMNAPMNHAAPMMNRSLTMKFSEER